MTKNDILKALDNLGFNPEELSEEFYLFKYEDVNYLYIHDVSDEDFLRISIPAIFQGSSENEDMLMPIINQANNFVKYAKIVYSQDMVWATVEYPLFKWVDIEEVLEFAIDLLQHAAVMFNKLLRGGLENGECEEDQP